jgi:hypothetical protein
VSARLNSLPFEPHALQKDAEHDIADALGLTVEIAPGKGEAAEIIIDAARWTSSRRCARS